MRMVCSGVAFVVESGITLSNKDTGNSRQEHHCGHATQQEKFESDEYVYLSFAYRKTREVIVRL